MNEMLNALTLLDDIKDKIINMDMVSFGSFYCMLAEEWCRAKDEDVTEFSEMIHNMIFTVNEECGRY